MNKYAFILDGKYGLPNLHFSLFSFPKTIHDTPPGTSPPSEGLGEAALRAWAVPSEQSLHFLPLIFYSSSPTLLFLSL